MLKPCQGADTSKRRRVYRLQLEALEDRLAPATFVVNSTDDLGDANPGDGIASTVVGPGGVTTLRAAIQEANANPDADLIHFGLAGAGPFTFTPTSGPYPDISQGLTIDGYTQAGAIFNSNGTAAGSNAVLRILIDGSALPAANGFTIISSQPVTIRGLAINGFRTNQFGENGLNLAGNGIAIFQNGSHAIEGNFIGTDITGTVATSNQANGVLISSSNNRVGGTATAARNVISGNGSHGIAIANQAIAANANTIQGNLIGTDLTGTLALGNGANGVLISGNEQNVIGGATAAARNLISANAGNGILMTGGIEGGSPAERNQVLGNYIGTQINGIGDLGNVDAGVLLEAAEYNAIGGTAAGAGNIIAFNGLTAGVVVTPLASGNPIRGNSIFSNDGLGIDLQGGTQDSFGVTANDADDSDAGANHLQNYPVLTSAVTSPVGTTITGTLTSTAGDQTTPTRTFEIDFYANLVADESGFGEGRTFLGFVRVTTSSGTVSFTAAFPPLPPGQNVITATATDVTLVLTGGGQIEPLNDTSEFSKALVATQVVLMPVPARVFHPFRLVRKGNIYSGFITLLTKASFAAPTTIVLRNLPPGVVLRNATGTTPDGSPFITVNRALRRNVPLRIRLVYTNSQGRYAVTFYHGFRVDVFSGAL